MVSLKIDITRCKKLYLKFDFQLQQYNISISHRAYNDIEQIKSMFAVNIFAF